METVVGRRKAATCLLLLTYLISTRACAAKTATTRPRAVALCLPVVPHDGSSGSSFRQSSAAVSTTRRHHPTTAMYLVRAPLHIEGSFAWFERTRAAARGKHMQSSRGAECRLSASTSDPIGGPATVSIPSIPVVAGASAACRTGASVDAAEPASSAGPPVLSIKWGREQIQRLQRQVCELPEDTAEEGRFLMKAALVGVITGTAVTVFKTLIGAVKEFSYTDLIASVPSGPASTYVGAFVPVLGAVGVVSVMWLLQLKSYGPGLGGLTEEVDRQVPWVPQRTIGKTLAAVATLGTGNSLGPEGPAVELGVASSRFVSSISNLSVQRQRMLLGAGAAAGVAAGFNAPIAGIFFALEIVKDTFNTNYNSKSFIAATLLCAVVSALMAKIGLHDELSLRPAAYNLESPLIELPLYLGLGVVAGLVAVMFKFFSRKSADVFKGNFPGFGWMKNVPQWSKPIMMASVTGAVGVFYPQVLFFGYDTLDKLLANTGSYSLPLLCFLCVAKALLTAGSLGSGLVGGTFAPSLFLGATAGAAYQRILQGSLTAFRSAAGPSLAAASVFLLPITSRLGVGGGNGDLSSLLTIAGSPAYAMVGAAAVLSALYRAPLTGSLLLFELTKDYDIVLPLMAAAGVSSLVVELFSRADAPAVQPMPRDMSLEIGLKISGKVDKLMGKIQVADALVPRILTLTADTSLPEAMRAFRLTRNEFAVVVAESGFETYDASASRPPPLPQTSINGDDASGWHAQTILAEDMWERRDLKLVGVLALREIILALDRERASLEADRANGKVKPELTAGSVCRQDCVTVKASTDIGQAKRLMNLKAIRFLPVVVDLPPSASAAASPSSPPPPPPPPPSVDTATPTQPFARRWPNNRGGDEGPAAVPPPPPPPPRQQAVVGVLSRESVRIAGRLTETERAIRDRPAFSPPTSSYTPSDDEGGN